MYLEPFGAAVVEAQLCGLPVLTPDFGAFLETVEQDRTGYRCHTLADYAHGVTQALQGHFDSTYIRERAKAKYDMYKVARDYDMAFRNILNIHNGANGWYGQDSFLSL
jgi:glycosyltransferase involved in cell wall biosynthesis